jgi:nucleotide-binding universal stress UspA family protein
VNNPNTVEEMVNLSVTLKSKKNKSGLIALNVVDTLSEDKNLEKNAKKILDKAAVMASSTDNRLTELMRYDNSIVNGITSVVKEHRITDLILGLHKSEGISDSFLGDLTENVLSKSNITTLIYKSSQPLNTIKRHVVVVPEKAEKEIGFPFWLLKIWNIAKNSGGQIVFYAPLKTLKFIREVYANHPIDAKFEDFDNWDEFLILSREIKEDDNIIVVLSRKDYLSYNKGMLNVPSYLDKYFSKNNFLLIYPMQAGVMDNLSINYNNPSVLNPLQENLEKLDEIGKTIGKVFRKKK